MKGFKKVTLLALASSIGLSYGCGSSNLGMYQFPTYQPFSVAPQYNMYKREGAKKWTIMVHLGADNNLYSYGLKDMDEMAAGLKGEDINVIVLFDGDKTGDSAIYKIKAGGKDIVDDGGVVIPPSKEINSGDPQVLAKFTQWAIKTFPADHYMLDIWDHGSGIFRGNKNDITKSFAYDDAGGHMNTKDLGPILSVAAQAAGKKIDILGFDACLMGHLEMAYQVKDFCNVLVGSEDTEPGDGWYYKGWFEKLTNGKCGLTPAAVATCLVDSYGESYQPGGGQSGSNVTLSAIDINAAIGGFVPVFNQFAVALQKGLAANKPVISKARDNTQSFYNSNCADIGHFMKLVQKESLPADITGLASNALAAYQKSIIRVYPGTASKGWGSVADASGMVVYFPKSYHTYNTTYDNPNEILFAQQPAWGSFLKEFIKK